MKLEDFKPDKWCSILAVSGGLIAVAAVWNQFISAFVIGIGLFLFGAGESVNRTKRTEVKEAPGLGRYKVTGNPWRPSAGGLILDAAGIFLFGVGVYWLLFPHPP
jgi:hypothetical protein